MRRFSSHLLIALISLSLVPASVTHAEPSNETTVPMSHMPAWVQVSSTSAPLFASDTGSAGSGIRLSRHAYLRVLGGGQHRLLVETTGDSAGQRAWIDPDDVVPSGPADGWLVAATPTTLWQSPSEGSAASRTLDQFTPLLHVDGPVRGRLEVFVYRSDFLRVVERGWVEVEHTGPALAPATRVAPPVADVPGSRGAAGSSEQQAFLTTAAEAAMASRARTGVPASVTVAQAILESDWGRSLLSRQAGNYFGMKAFGGLGNDGVVWLPTHEYNADGELYETISPFRAYKSLTDSMIDHDNLLKRLSRYAPAMEVAHDPREFAHRLAAGGYSTDPAYADKLIALMDRYDLYRLDA